MSRIVAIIVSASLSVSALAFTSTIAAEEPVATADIGSYDDYLETARISCDESRLFRGWKNSSPLKNIAIPYTELGDEATEEKYANYLDQIRTQNACVSDEKYAIPAIDRAVCAYVETQNMLFGCYSVRTRIRIAETMLDQFGGNSSAKQKLEARIEALRSASGEWGDSAESVCNPIHIPDASSPKLELLKNATVHQCRYQYYLIHLQERARNDITGFFFVPGGLFERGINPDDTELMVRALSGVVYALAEERRHARAVYYHAMEAFVEMERTYAQHLMLSIILEDLVAIRSGLQSLLNPMGQFIYKASNAQSPYNR